MKITFVGDTRAFEGREDSAGEMLLPARSSSEDLFDVVLPARSSSEVEKSRRIGR